MDKGFSLRVFKTLSEAFLFDFKTGIKITRVHCGFNALNDHFWRKSIAHFPSGTFSGVVKNFLIVSIFFYDRNFIADSSNLAARFDDLLCKLNGCFNYITVSHFIGNAKLSGLRSRYRVSRQNKIKSFFCSD